MLSADFTADLAKFLPFASRLDRDTGSWTNHKQLLRFLRIPDNHPGVRLAHANSNEPTPSALPEVDESLAFASSNALHGSPLLVFLEK